MHSVNLFKIKAGETPTYQSTTKSHFTHSSFRAKESNALRRKLHKEHAVELAERNRSAASLANERFAKAFKRVANNTAGEEPKLSYDAKKIKSFMEKKTSLW